MSIEQFVWVCNEYNIYPQLVLEDLRKSSKMITSEPELRVWIEEHY